MTVLNLLKKLALPHRETIATSCSAARPPVAATRACLISCNQRRGLAPTTATERAANKGPSEGEGTVPPGGGWLAFFDRDGESTGL